MIKFLLVVTSKNSLLQEISPKQIAERTHPLNEEVAHWISTSTYHDSEI